MIEFLKFWKWQRPRFWDWGLLAIGLFTLLYVTRIPSVYIALVGQQQPDGSIVGGFVPKDIIVLLWKVSTVSIGAILGLWLDYSAFPYGRPDRVVPGPDDAEPWPMGDAVAFSGACLRRAIIVIGFVFALGLAT